LAYDQNPADNRRPHHITPSVAQMETLFIRISSRLRGRTVLVHSEST